MLEIKIKQLLRSRLNFIKKEHFRVSLSYFRHL